MILHYMWNKLKEDVWRWRKIFLAIYDTRKNRIKENFRSIKKFDRKEIVFRMVVTDCESADIPDTKQLKAKTTWYRLPPGIYGSSYPNFMLLSIFTNDVKVNITIEDTRKKNIFNQYENNGV